jgi:phosphate transport system substrate-binding protein
MARGRRLALIAASAVLAMGSLAVAGCGDDDDSGSNTAGGGDSAGLSGNITIDGSSTVGPLTSAAAEAFNAENPDVDITVGTSGTGGGFELFCKGETDINDASRAINDEDIALCEAGGVTYEEFRVASDGITLVTSINADLGGDNLTLPQLKAIWAPDSKIDNWDAIPGGSFNDVPLTLAGPDSQSGTYDFFNETVLGKDANDAVIESRQDYSASADDNVTVRAVQSAEGGLGYFGYTYFEENADTLKDFSIDGIKPTAETITDGTYPLSRPLFIYVSTTSLAKPEVKAFVQYYLENAITLADEQQFVPAPQEALDAGLAELG